MRSILRKLIQNEAGQATIEYILVLVVVIGVILGSLYQFNDAFGKWADNYFGNYLACLLETGELPALGGSVGSAGECNGEFKEFSIAEGRPLIEQGPVGEGGGGPASEDESTGEDGSSGGASGGGGSVSAERRSFSSFGSGRPSRFRARPQQASSDEEGGSKQTGGGTVTDLQGYQTGKVVRIPIREREGYSGGRSRAKKKDEKETRTKVANVNQSGGEKSGPKLIRVERKAASNSEGPEIEEFTFGKLFKYLIIAALILALVLFIGSQILQVSKSME